MKISPSAKPLWRCRRQENRKRETRQLAAQVVRREEEMTENHLGDNESEGDAPDDDDDLDEVDKNRAAVPASTNLFGDLSCFWVKLDYLLRRFEL